MRWIYRRIPTLRKYKCLEDRLFASEKVSKKGIFPALAVGAQCRDAGGGLAAGACLPGAQLVEYLIKGPINQVHEHVRIGQRSFYALQPQQHIPALTNFAASA
jgi:hypothetical protein